MPRTYTAPSANPPPAVKHGISTTLSFRKESKKQVNDVSSRVAPADVDLSNTRVVRRATSRYVYPMFFSDELYQPEATLVTPANPNVSLTTSSVQNLHRLQTHQRAKVIKAAKVTAGGETRQRRPSLRPTTAALTETASEYTRRRHIPCVSPPVVSWQPQPRIYQTGYNSRLPKPAHSAAKTLSRAARPAR